MRTVLPILLFSLLTACTSAEWHSINRSFDPSAGDSRLIDAKQRAIISVRREVLNGKRESGDNKPVTVLAMCAEPSPDALQATATALAGSSGGDALANYLNLSFSNSETAASIALRTQTIQLLRDAYFRLCEAFLNDGLDAIAYDVLQRRFQNQITALLAVEQLTGTVTAAQAALNTSATGNAGAQAALVNQTLKAEEDNLSALKKAREENSTELDSLTSKKKELSSELESSENALKENKDESKAENLMKDVRENKDSLDRNTKRIKEAEQDKDKLDNQINRTEKLISTLEAAFSEAATALITTSATGIGILGSRSATSNLNHSDAVASAVRAITLNAMNQDYETQVCFETLRYRNNINDFRNSIARTADVVKLRSRLEDQLATAKGRFTALEGQLAVAKDRVTQLQDPLTKARDDVTAHKDKLPEAEGDVARLLDQLATARHKVTEVEGQLMRARDNVTAREDQLAKAEGDVVDLSGQLATAQGKVIGLQDQLATAKGRVTDLNGQVMTAKGRVTDLNGQVMTAKDRVSKLEGQLALAQGWVAELGGQLVAAQRRVTDLRDLVATAEAEGQGKNEERRDPGPGNAFLQHCQRIFEGVSGLRNARSTLVANFATAIDTIVKKVGQGENELSAQEASQLILALSEAIPMEPGTAFLKRKLELPTSGAGEKLVGLDIQAIVSSDVPIKEEIGSIVFEVYNKVREGAIQ